MRDLSIDIETYSGTDLTACGTYKYVQDPDHAILLFAYAFDDDPVSCVDIASGEQIPDRVINAMYDAHVKKHAHGAPFELNNIETFFWEYGPLKRDQWHCTMVTCASTGLPLDLAKAAVALKLDAGKDKEGKALIEYFCRPCKPTKVNGMRTRNMPWHAPEKWKRFIEYCKQDVRVERNVRKKLYFSQPSAFERRLWLLDQRINARGVMLDAELCRAAIYIDEIVTKELSTRATQLTGMSNPNSPDQIKNWLHENTGDLVLSLTVETVEAMLEKYDSPVVREMLKIRQGMGKTSVNKYYTMLDYLCADGRVHGMFQFAGAGRTGRWAGRGPQLHNLPKNEMEMLDMARELLLLRDSDYMRVFFSDISYVLSQLIRTALVPRPGHRFIVADFSQFEARILAWFAGCQWRLDVFMTHGKIYEASASKMSKVPIHLITKKSPLRAKGKVSELLLGYGGGPKALIRGKALKMGVKEEELPMIVKMWRNANPEIVQFWRDVEKAAILAVQGYPQKLHHGLEFFVEKNILWIKLPSGRKLAYLRPRLVEGKYGPAIQYEGISDKKVWGMQDTYGGKLVENIVQATQRDLLGNAMLQADDADYSIVVHVHDELVCEMPDGVGSVDELCQLMMRGVGPQYAGLPLDAEGFETMYYKKE